jgi:8-oxo-dGTP diphosphatase
MAEVEAAGGLVWRRVGADVEIVIVHRPRYDDWSLPKGKLDDGESFEQAAVREVEEETGLSCELGDFLGETTYTDHKDREKLAKFWLMEARDDKLAGDDEVDDLRWVPIAEAESVLSYAFDRVMVERAAGMLGSERA